MKKFTYSLVIVFLLPFCTAFGQDPRSALRDGAAKWKPLQSDVEIDPIADEEIALCELVISDDNWSFFLI